MKTKMFKFGLVIALMIWCAPVLEAQNTDYGMVRITFVKAKIGMEAEFASSVAEFNAKFHSEAPFTARLDRIATGKEAGWFVWIMGPLTFTDLDNWDTAGARAEYLKKNVYDKVAKFGRTEFWRYNPDLSYAEIDEPTAVSNLWLIDIADNQYHRFKTFMEKINKAFAKMNRDNMRVYNNQFNEDDGRDVVIVWTATKWADMDEANDDLEATYDEIHGKGAWQTAMDDWQDFTVSVQSTLWMYDVK